VLFVSPPDVLHGVAKAKAHVFGDLNTLDPGWVGCVVFWVVYGIVIHDGLL
jgi:hypothetical protein